MENKKTLSEGVDEYFRREIRPFFDRVPQETRPNPLSGGVGAVRATDYFFFDPHNFRRWIDFSRENLDFSAYKDRTSIRNEPIGSIFSCGTINHNSEIQIKAEFFNFTIKKTQIEIINLKDHNQLFRIPVSSAGTNLMQNIIARKERECLEALSCFISIFGGKSSFKILNAKAEHKVSGESSIKKIPASQKFHTPLFKKVYNEPSIEFYDSVHSVNYISNRSIESIAPDIAENLRMLAGHIATVQPLQTLKNLVNCIDDVLKYRSLVLVLSDYDKKSFENWLYIRFGNNNYSS